MGAWNPHTGLVYRPPTRTPTSMLCASSSVRLVASDPFPRTKRRLSAHSLPSSHETALMLDRLISINDRIPLSPCVNLPPVPGRQLSAIPLFFFSFLLWFLFSPVSRSDDDQRVAVRRESISRFHSASIPQISILDYLRRIVRFTNLEVCPVLSRLPIIPSSPSFSSLSSIITTKQATRLTRNNLIHTHPTHLCTYVNF